MSARNMAKRTAAGTLALAVCLGGGALALAGAANADANFQFSSRIQGADRYGTAIAASQAAFKDGSAQNVVIVNGYATVDGLTASYLAGVANAPILYVDQNGASDATKAELKRLGAKNIWLVGGTTVIPQSVQDAMSGAGYTVNRINGSDRYETAKLIAEAGAKMAGKQPAKVFVASGDSFADALAVSPIAYAKGYAIALTQKDTTSAFTTKELGNIGTNTKILVGGTAVVSDSVAQNLTVSQRIAGADRGVTANLVADYANSTEGFNASQAALVGGTDGNGADSLVGASVLGKTMTALHFAGWDSTTQWFKDHSAQLTGAGVIFGGKAAVSDGMVSTVQSAAQSVAAAAGMVVTSLPTGSSTTFGYADPVQKKQVKVTPASTDKFLVGGVAATQGAFVNSLTIGSTVVITAPTTTGGPTTYSLTVVAANSTMSGLIGAYSATNNTSSTISIVEPVTGAVLNSISFANVANVVYTVDGNSVSQGIFESSLSAGDSVSVTGTGADSSHLRTVALTSGSLSGTVATITGSNPITSIGVQTAAGAILSMPAPASGDTVSIDGAASTYTVFNGSSTPVTVGDQITYARSGGVAKVALVNAAPSSVSGVVAAVTSAGSTNGSGVTYYSPAGSPVVTAYPSSARYVVNGTVAAKADFIAAASAGSWITYQAPDATTNTTASFTLVSKPLSGAVLLDATNTTNSGASHTLAIADGDGDTLSYNTGIAYSGTGSLTSVYSTGTSLAYQLDGNAATLAQFDAAVGRISSGARTGAVTVSINNGVVMWSLSTTAFTTAPTITKVSSVAATASAPTFYITFNKPVTMGSANSGAPVAADWVVSVNGVSYSLTGSTLSWVAGTNQTQLKIVGNGNLTSTNGQSLVIAPTSATTASNYLDTYGTVLGSASFTGAIG